MVEKGWISKFTLPVHLSVSVHGSSASLSEPVDEALSTLLENFISRETANQFATIASDKEKIEFLKSQFY
jgi:hypothetical protein